MNTDKALLRQAIYIRHRACNTNISKKRFKLLTEANDIELSVFVTVEQEYLNEALHVFLMWKAGL